MTSERYSAGPRTPTETEVNDALAVLRRDYYADVRGLVDAWREARDWHRTNKPGEAFDAGDALHQVVDSSQRVIYTYQARVGLLCTDNADACEEELGEKPESPEAAMFWALMADVRELLGDEYSDDEPADEEEALSADDIADFNGYLRNCTDSQVAGVYQKERSAGRRAYAALAEAEGIRRGIAVK
jgi:hypothetical protein